MQRWYRCVREGGSTVSVRALHLLSDSQNDELEADSVKYTAEIGTCKRGERWAWTLVVLGKMQSHGVEAIGVHYQAVISLLKVAQWALAGNPEVRAACVKCANEVVVVAPMPALGLPTARILNR